MADNNQQGQPKEQSPLDEKLNHWISPSPIHPFSAMCFAAFMIPRGAMYGYLGQVNKWMFFTIQTICIGIFAAIPFPPLQFVVLVLVVGYLGFVTAHDAYVLSKRLNSGIPVMIGECGNRFAAFGLKKFMNNTPVFVTDSDDAPAEYKQKVEGHA